MLKAKVIKELEVDIKQMNNWIKNDFNDYDTHKSISQLVSNIDTSLEVTKDQIKDLLKLYNL